MRTIIAGSRGITDYAEVEAAVYDSYFTITAVLSGRARGVDRLGERWAAEHGVDLETYPALWKVYGREAGFIRNIQMAEKADALVAVWDGVSGGTAHMIRTAKIRGLRIHIHRVR